MELLVATWTLRLAMVATLAVGLISYSAGSPLIESVDRAIAAAFVFTLAGRLLMGWLESPEQRVMRMRQRRDARRAKATGKAAAGGKTAAGGDAAKRKPKKSGATVAAGSANAA